MARLSPAPATTVAEDARWRSYADDRLLDELRVRRDQADALVAQIRACDAERARLDRELDRRKAKLDDPALADHPLRAKARARYDELTSVATLIPFTRRRLADDLAEVLAKAVSLRHRLSPHAREHDCVAIFDRAFCVGIDPEGAAWDAVDYPAETPEWAYRRRALMRRHGKDVE